MWNIHPIVPFQQILSWSSSAFLLFFLAIFASSSTINSKLYELFKVEAKTSHLWQPFSNHNMSTLNIMWRWCTFSLQKWKIAHHDFFLPSRDSALGSAKALAGKCNTKSSKANSKGSKKRLLSKLKNILIQRKHEQSYKALFESYLRYGIV